MSLNVLLYDTDRNFIRQFISTTLQRKVTDRELNLGSNKCLAFGNGDLQINVVQNADTAITLLNSNTKLTSFFHVILLDTRERGQLPMQFLIKALQFELKTGRRLPLILHADDTVDDLNSHMRSKPPECPKVRFADLHSLPEKLSRPCLQKQRTEAKLHEIYSALQAFEKHQKKLIKKKCKQQIGCWAFMWAKKKHVAPASPEAKLPRRLSIRASTQMD